MLEYFGEERGGLYKAKGLFLAFGIILWVTLVPSEIFLKAVLSDAEAPLIRSI